MKKVFAVLALFALLCAPQSAEAMDASKRAKIVKMIEVSGGTSSMTKMFDMFGPQMLAKLRKSAPNLSEAHAQELSDIMIAEFNGSIGDLLNKMIPLYDEVFTIPEIEASIAFYSTPEGQSMMKKLPHLMQGSVAISQQWAQQVAQSAAEKVIKHAQKLGYKI